MHTSNDLCSLCFRILRRSVITKHLLFMFNMLIFWGFARSTIKIVYTVNLQSLQHNHQLKFLNNQLLIIILTKMHSIIIICKN
jgi:hypothetical protein